MFQVTKLGPGDVTQNKAETTPILRAKQIQSTWEVKLKLCNMA